MSKKNQQSEASVGEFITEFTGDEQQTNGEKISKPPTPNSKNYQIKFPTLSECSQEENSRKTRLNSKRDKPERNSNSKSKPELKSELMPKSKLRSKPKSKSDPKPISVSDSESEQIQESAQTQEPPANQEENDSVFPPENWSCSRQYISSRKIINNEEPETSKIDKLFTEIQNLKDKMKEMGIKLKNHDSQIWNSCQDIIDISEDTKAILGANEDFHTVLECLEKVKDKLKGAEEKRDCMENGRIGKCILARTNWKFIKKCVFQAQSEEQIRYCLRRNLPVQHKLLVDCLSQDQADMLLKEISIDYDPRKFLEVSLEIEDSIAAALEYYEMEFEEGKRVIKVPKKGSK